MSPPNKTKFRLPSYFPAPSFRFNAASMTGVGNAQSSHGRIYSYLIPQGGYAPNGNILEHQDSVVGDWVFSYDAVDRLSTAQNITLANKQSSAKYNGLYGCWTYDQWGNRTMEAVSTTPCNAGPTPQVWATYQNASGTLNNRIATTNLGPSTVSAGVFGYDAAGDTSYDGLNNYWYDAEGQLCAVKGPTGALTAYVYDAEGARIAKGTLTAAPGAGATCAALFANGAALGSTASGVTFSLNNRYLVDLGGDQVTELNGAGAWQLSNVWAGGKLVATYDTKGLHYALTDPLGTKRLQANVLGQVDEYCSQLPFGNDLNNPANLSGTACVATANSLGTSDDATEHHFIDRERDSESGNDYLLARYYSSALGRFTTPDWAAKAMPVPYAVFVDPESLNLYAYVRNNPVTHMDPDGHWDCGKSGKDAGSLACNVQNEWNRVHEIASNKIGEAKKAINNAIENTVTKIKGPLPPAPNQVPAAPGVPPPPDVTYKGEKPPANPLIVIDPNSALGSLEMCTADCMNPIPITVTSTSEDTPQHPPGTPHRRAEAWDFKAGVNDYPGSFASHSKAAMWCSAYCGAGFGQDEFSHPSAKATAGHDHAQTGPGLGGSRGDLPQVP